MRNPRLPALLVPLLLSLLLPGCKSARETAPAHALAQQCVAIRNPASGAYLTAASDTAYRFSTGGEQAAEKFFLKPSALGTFLLYDRDGRFLSTQLIHVTRDATASQRAEWRINKLALYRGHRQVDEKFTLVSIIDNLRLQQGKSGPIIRLAGEQVPEEAG